MSTAPCPDCQRPYALTLDGQVRRHGCTGVTIALPWSAPLTQNQLRRMHHQREAAIKRDMSDAARWTIRAARPVLPTPPVEVTLHYRPGTRRLCDPDGIAPSCKVAIDALVKEGLLPGDDWRYVVATTQRIHEPQRGMPACFWLSVHAPKETK